MRQSSDLKTLQREQARQRMIARTQETLLGYLFLGSLLLTIAGAVAAVLSIYVFLRVGSRQVLMLSVPGALGAALFGWLTMLCLRGMTKLKRKVERLSYMPRSNDGSLPSVEVLVRGASEPPSAMQDSLLRAARGNETPADELLRMSSGKEPDSSQKKM